MRIRLQLDKQLRDFALFDFAIDSKLRGCDRVRLHVQDGGHGNQVLAWASVVQGKTDRPVRFELSEQTREAVRVWIEAQHLTAGSFLFPSRSGPCAPRTCARFNYCSDIMIACGSTADLSRDAVLP